MTDCKELFRRFVQIGESIHTMRGNDRISMATHAQTIVKKLVAEEDFLLSLPAVEYDRFFVLRAKVSAYLDGELPIMTAAVREYFLLRHARVGLDADLFSLSTFPKRSGVQAGAIFDISDGKTAARYFVKTHQHGPTSSGNQRSIQPSDAKEVFIYKLLELIGVGPQVHFIIPAHETVKTIYIATQQVDNLLLLSQLTTDTADKAALLELDLLSRILRLLDTTTNSSNCGLDGTRPVVIDFRIETQPSYFDPLLLRGFIDGNGRYNYDASILMSSASRLTVDEKDVILKAAAKKWNLFANIDAAFKWTRCFMATRAATISFFNDLDLYVTGIKRNVASLAQ